MVAENEINDLNPTENFQFLHENMPHFKASKVRLLEKEHPNRKKRMVNATRTFIFYIHSLFAENYKF